jgi:hypothetical protein
MKEMECQMVSDDKGDVFIVVDGVKIARRGYPGTPQALTWVSLEPGWTVLDAKKGREIVVEYNGVRVQ